MTARLASHQYQHRGRVRRTQFPTNLLRGLLADIRRHQHRRRPDSQPADDPAGVEQAQPAGRDGLHDGADGHDEAGEHQAEAAAEAVGAVGHEQRAEEAAGLEGGNDVALDIGEVGRGDAKVALEGGEGDGAADEAGV